MHKLSIVDRKVIPLDRTNEPGPLFLTKLWKYYKNYGSNKIHEVHAKSGNNSDDSQNYQEMFYLHYCEKRELKL